MERWKRLLIAGGVLVLVQWVFPDFVSMGINNLLGRSDISAYTGLEPFLRALLVVWKVSGGGLFVAGIVDWVRSRRQS
jgi:hypothetical protein